MKKVLVLSPHPDDESLGCGGTIRKHVVEGDRVHVIFITSGERGGHGRSKEETKMVREQEARDAAKVLGIAKVDFWRVPNGAFRVNEALIKKLQTEFKQWKPDVIYV